MNTDERVPRPEGDARTIARGSRASGCLAFVLLVGALPILGVGFVIYTSSAQGAAASSGTGGALSGLGELVGIAAMVLGAVVFVLGAMLFARSAK